MDKFEEDCIAFFLAPKMYQWKITSFYAWAHQDRHLNRFYHWPQLENVVIFESCSWQNYLITGKSNGYHDLNTGPVITRWLPTIGKLDHFVWVLKGYGLLDQSITRRIIWFSGHGLNTTGSGHLFHAWLNSFLQWKMAFKCIFFLAKENVKTASYSVVIIVGVCVTGFIAFTIFRELFSGDSPNSLFQVPNIQAAFENLFAVPIV